MGDYIFKRDGRNVIAGSYQANPNKQEYKNKKIATNSRIHLWTKFNCLAQKVDFDELKMQNLKGNVTINNGKLQLKKSGFDIVGSNVNMDVIYGSESPEKAFFEFEVLAKDFDVKRAYNEVKMFREMASAAESAEGIVSLDYKVVGKLNNAMQPIYPSLKGGGTLSVKNVKMKGFKMFGAVSKKTGKDAIKNPDLSKVDIKTTIKNNGIIKNLGYCPFYDFS